MFKTVICVILHAICYFCCMASGRTLNRNVWNRGSEALRDVCCTHKHAVITVIKAWERHGCRCVYPLACV